MNDEVKHEQDRIYTPSNVTPSKWVRRGVLLLVGLALAAIAYAIGSAFFPRWWAQRVADQVQGDLTAGTWLGLVYGFVFTFVPLLVLAQVRRRFLNWTWRGIVAVFAVLLSAPNLLTLAVVVSNSKAAHAGERIMDVDAPGFRNASTIGAVVGAVLAVLLVLASMRLAGRRRQVKELKGKVRESEKAEEERRRAAEESERD